jgi:signal peptidase I
MSDDRFEGVLSVLFRVGALFAGVVIGFIVLRLFIVPFRVSDSSMVPELQKGDQIFLFKAGKPVAGDIVLVRSPIEKERVSLKRVIAVEGDTIEVRSKIIYRNGVKFVFKWKVNPPDERIFPMNFSGRDNSAPLKLKRGEYFIIGDNIDYSMDSRAFGPVREKDVIGVMIFRI